MATMMKKNVIPTSSDIISISFDELSIYNCFKSVLFFRTL